MTVEERQDATCKALELALERRAAADAAAKQGMAEMEVRLAPGIHQKRQADGPAMKGS